MTSARDGTPFGAANLTNCERELIHLAGSIQPHGALVVVQDHDFTVLQASANTASVLGIAHEALLGRSLASLGGNVVERLESVLLTPHLAQSRGFRCHADAGGRTRPLEGLVHRHPEGGVIVEFEPDNSADTIASALPHLLGDAIARVGNTYSLQSLAETSVQHFRRIAGYDRVMFYRFDVDGHGEIVAEARDESLESFLGLHYPASDIPHRARDLYVRNRVRVLVDVHYEPVALVPRRFPLTGDELDMSLSYLRSMSPLHLQYLKNMGVTGTLVASLVRDGRLWGLIACHHYAPRQVSYALRTACELLAEVISTRVATLERLAQRHAEELVRRLEQRLVEATSTDGDWRVALFRNPRAVLQPLDATGAALFYDGDVLTAGEVPSTSELRQLREWASQTVVDGLASTSSIARTAPSLTSLTPTASGVLVVELSRARGDYLMWLRKEQVRTVTWAGDPSKPVVGNDPLDLSPRRSFAAWSEQVQQTAQPWSPTEIDFARAIGAKLVDITLQIHAVRLLIAQHQLTHVRLAVEQTAEPVVIADGNGRILLANESFSQMFRIPYGHLLTVDDLAPLFTDGAQARTILHALKTERHPWRGELSLLGRDGMPRPVDIRADVVPGHGNTLLGFILIFTDLTNRKEAEAARLHLQRSIERATPPRGGLLAGRASPADPVADGLAAAIFSHASTAAMDITEGAYDKTVAPLLREVEESALRAAALVRQLRAHTALDGNGGAGGAGVAEGREPRSSNN